MKIIYNLCVRICPRPYDRPFGRSKRSICSDETRPYAFEHRVGPDDGGIRTNPK
jgi:hypothetical protein